MRILFVGRFHPIKGLDYLVTALSLLRRDDLKLTVVADAGGYEPYRRSVIRLIQALSLRHSIDMIGPVGDVQRLIQIYRGSDVLALPSLWETSPIVVPEAMCLGLPVVGSRVGGIVEAVQDGETGLLVPPGDPVSLALAIQGLAEDPDLLNELAANALRASKRYRDRTWEHVQREYRALFEKYLDNQWGPQAEQA